MDCLARSLAMRAARDWLWKLSRRISESYRPLRRRATERSERGVQRRVESPAGRGEFERRGARNERRVASGEFEGRAKWREMRPAQKWGDIPSPLLSSQFAGRLSPLSNSPLATRLSPLVSRFLPLSSRTRPSRLDSPLASRLAPPPYLRNPAGWWSSMPNASATPR